jgi:hypothetical protein
MYITNYEATATHRSLYKRCTAYCAAMQRAQCSVQRARASAQRTPVPTTNVASPGADVAAEQPSGPQGLEAFRTACRDANPRWPRTHTEINACRRPCGALCAARCVGLRDVVMPGRCATTAPAQRISRASARTTRVWEAQARPEPHAAMTSNLCMRIGSKASRLCGKAGLDWRIVHTGLKASRMYPRR